MNYYWLLLLLIIPSVNDAYAQQVITVNSTVPCFLNATAGIHMWENCGADEDFVSFALLPFEWITGGYFSMILISVIILAVYMKYQKAIYAVAIGVVFIPISFQFFPDQFLSFAAIAVFLGLTATVYYLIRDQLR